MKKIGLALALLAAVAVLLGVAGTSSAHRKPAPPPDNYVTSWDAVGSQAFTAAALSPPEGFVIFAYVAIAVYDSVTAISVEDGIAIGKRVANQVLSLHFQRSRP